MNQVKDEKFLNLKIILQILIILGLVSLLVATSFAWFADKANPSISETQIKVTTADGLVIKLSPDSTGRTTVSLNQLFTDFNEFQLKQVSSADGASFYKIDFGQGLALQNPSFVLLDTSPEEMNMIEYGFINYDFYLATEEYAKHVYMHNETGFSGIASNAMRISITMTDSNEHLLCNFIFGTTAENGIYDPQTTHAITSAGTFEYGSIPSSMYGTQIVRTFAEKNGGRGTSDDAPIDLNKILATIPAQTTVKMNIKIWLEGGDVDCTNSIASSLLDVMLKFGSANVLLTAPTLSANRATNTITGLTTDMEWATTNTGTTIWTPVTNPNMTFTGLMTVYVRIAEDPGVNPESYVTTVNFQ